MKNSIVTIVIIAGTIPAISVVKKYGKPTEISKATQRNSIADEIKNESANQ